MEICTVGLSEREGYGPTPVAENDIIVIKIGGAEFRLTELKEGRIGFNVNLFGEGSHQLEVQPVVANSMNIMQAKRDG